MDAVEALGDPTRRVIVELLARRPRTAGQIADRFEVSRPAISRHLRVLREADMVRATRRGQQRVYDLNPQPLQDLQDWLGGVQAFWAQRLDALATEVARGRPQSAPEVPSPTERRPDV